MVDHVYRAILRQLSTGEAAAILLPPYDLSDHRETVMGRDPGCDVALDPHQYLVVSRRHATIRSLSPSAHDLPHWEICDLNSANGTFVNGQYLQGCQPLQTGDRIELGRNGPLFIFEYQFNPSPTPLYPPPQTTYFTAAASSSATPVSSVGKPKPESVTFTQLFPLASTAKDLRQKAYLVPGIVTVVFVVLMFAAVGQQDVFNLLLASYLAAAAYFFVYRLCGKPKPWWVLLLCGLLTGLILVGPLLPLFITIFRDILPGQLPNEGEEISLMSLFIRMFFGAGLMEELLKALPVMGIYIVGKLLYSPWREKIGVWEPLDGILLGAASAVGFALIETLGQYVPGIIDSVKLQAGETAGQLSGLHLLIARILGLIVGHMAYSGYLGYFIGLSILKRHQRWLILLFGYVCAAFLHALWNTSGFVSPVLLAVVGMLSYAFLAAAILKARALSPTRSQNFATRLFGE